MKENESSKEAEKEGKQESEGNNKKQILLST
jgi:hypothetical protein